MPESKLVAIVGRPNVGKSRLFNRLAGRRISIVHDQPGVTRDAISIESRDGYTLMDTGGIGLEDKNTPHELAEATENQAEFAIQAATLILFITDGKEGLTPLDIQIAELLRPHQKKVILVANKMDNPENQLGVADMAVLGMGSALPVSAEHNLGLEELKQSIAKELGPIETAPKNTENRITLSLVGRPNAGKSSLGNRLLNSDRLIVADIPGTTRDMIETSLDYQDTDGKNWNFRLFDTAGLRAKRKVDSSVEYFSSVRTLRSIEYSDIVLQLIDAREGVTKQDKIIANDILEAGKAHIVVVTKWDYAVDSFKKQDIERYDSLEHFQNSYIEALRKSFFYLPDSPIVFTSSVSGEGIIDLLEKVIAMQNRLNTQIPTPKLNRMLAELMEHRPPSKLAGKRFKIFYAVQTGNRPFGIKIFCNRADKLQQPYKRYLERNLVKEYGLKGCPIKFELIGKKARYTEEED